MPVSDVFLSYARHDEPVARRFAEALTGAGLSVWWDDELRSGEVFDQAIEAALRAAKAVIVLWSPHSVSSRWVRAEATLADRNKTLVPVNIAPCERPIVFELMHTADLTGWQGDVNDRAWQDFLRDVRRQLGTDAHSGGPAASPAGKPPTGLPRLDQHSVVVLPFTNMGGDPEQDYFADGMTEDIITDLSKVSALMVIARNTAFTFKGKHVDVADVARQLNVTHVLEGSVRRAGNRVRVTAQLIDGSTSGHVWAERYDRDLDDIFALQDELSQAIVGALKLKLLPEEKKAIEARGTDNLEAYDLFLRAKDAQRRMQPQGAIAYAQAAVTLDPNFVDGWETLAILQMQHTVMVPETAAASIAAAGAAFARAAAVAGEDTARGHIYKGARLQLIDRDWSGAEAEYLAAGGIDNASKPLTAMPDFLQSTGRLTQLAHSFRELLHADPLYPLPIYSFTLDCLGRFDEADAESERMRRVGAAPHLIEYFSLLRRLARGDAYDAIIEQAERYLAIDLNYLPVLREILARLNDRPAMARLVHDAFADPFYQDASHMTGLSQLAGYCGEDDLAVNCLREAYVTHKGVTLIGLWHPLLAGTRKLDGFKQVLRDIGLVGHWQRSGKWADFVRPLSDDDFEIIG